MRRLSVGVLALMLAIPALPVGDRGANAADSILTDVLRRGTVRIAISTGNPPTRFEDENGNLQGYDIDIANYLAKQLGVTIEYPDRHRRPRRHAAVQKSRHYDRKLYP